MGKMPVKQLVAIVFHWVTQTIDYKQLVVCSIFLCFS